MQLKIEPQIAIDGRELTFEGTGIGRYTENLIKHLLKNDKETGYLVLTNGASIDLGEYPNLSTLSSKHMPDSEWERVFVPKVIDQFNIKLFHNTRSGNSHFYPLKTPYVATVHDIIPLKFHEYFPSGIVTKWKNNFPEYAKKAEHIITISHHSRKDIINVTGIDKSKISVIYQGIDPIFNSSSDEKSELLIQKHYDIKTPYILNVGRFDYYKNVRNLLKAYSSLPKKIRDNYHLVIAGQGAENHAGLIENLFISDNVKLLGYVPQELIPSLYRGATVFVLPSLYEGFGLTPLEAMKSGVPLLCSNYGPLPEILERGALYFNPVDIEDIRSKLMFMLKDKSVREKMKLRGFQQINKYSWDETAKKTLEIYKSILKK